MSEDPAHRSYWRVGHTGDPLGFVPPEICEYSHRFDDLRHRFRTVYIAELAETCLRETLADFRPKLSAIGNFQREMGNEAAKELAVQSITAAWRREHVLAPLLLRLDGPIYDLTDLAQRRSVEESHSGLLLEYDMQHLDLHEITTGRRVVTQTIAGDLYDDGVAAVRFPLAPGRQPLCRSVRGAWCARSGGRDRGAHRPGASAAARCCRCLGAHAGGCGGLSVEALQSQGQGRRGLLDPVQGAPPSSVFWWLDRAPK